MAKPLITIVFLINITGALVFTALWMKSIKRQLQIPSYENGQYDCLLTQFKAFCRDIFHFTSIEQICAYLSIFLFLHFIAKSLFEFLAQYSPFKFTKLTKCLSNIVQSTLLYTMILGFIIIPMLISNYQLKQQPIPVQEETPKQTVETGQKYSAQLIRQILETFFYGRVLFSIGYLLGILTSFQSFRAYGFGLIIASITVALSYTYDLNIWAYF